MICRAISEHRATYSDPLTAAKGEHLAIVREDAEYPDWLWCIDQSGKAGWVPKEYLQQSGHDGVLLHDYDAMELSVYPEEELELSREVGGWGWCTNRHGESGWVPLEKIRKLLGVPGQRDRPP